MLHRALTQVPGAKLEYQIRDPALGPEFQGYIETSIDAPNRTRSRPPDPLIRCNLQSTVREPHVGNEPTLRPDCGGPFRDEAGSDGTPPDGGPSPLVFLLLLPSGTIGLMANLQGHGQSRCITSP